MKLKKFLLRYYEEAVENDVFVMLNFLMLSVYLANFVYKFGWSV